MDLVNREVKHEIFGKGNVVNYDDSYIKINFKSGDKKFVFPDAFKDYITFVDQKANDLVEKKLEIKEEEKRQEEILLAEERALEQERLDIIEQNKKMRNHKIHPSIQSVFWTDEEEEESIFNDWQVFTGEIKSGKNKGQPRKLVRMNQRSACLITKRDEDVEEETRQIIGLFMAEETFNGRECEDGYIKAHQDYRIKLSKEEAEKMLFWNYYSDQNFPENTTWNSGKQRYYDNIWTAQILRDIVSLKDDPEEKKYAEDFFEYFCKINMIDKEKLPEADGALIKD